MENSDNSTFTAPLGPTEWNTAVVKIGVGPWEEEYGIPLPQDKKYDSTLLREGDSRNVVDKYRYWTREAIIKDLTPKRHPFEIAIENLHHDANIGTIVRTANAFMANKVHIVGRRRWNRRGAMVTDRYQTIEHQETVDELIEYARAQDLKLVVVDNNTRSVPIEGAVFPENCLFLFGHEGIGVSELAKQEADIVVSIAQFGSTRSINVGVAAGIVMHQWIQQHANWKNHE